MPEIAISRQGGEQSSRFAWLFLLAILLVALGVRAYGSNFGLPYVYHPDEPAIVDRALQIERTRDPNPHWFNYPSLYIYTQFAVIKLLRPALKAWSAWRGSGLDALQTQGAIYQVGRLVTVLLGVGTVAVVYATGRWLFSARAGLWAALALAGTSLHIESSRYITTDVPCAFFAACCLYFSAKAMETRAWGDFALGGLMAGLAASSKYNAGLVLVTTGMAFLLSRRRWRDLLDPVALVIPLAALAGFLAGTPYAALDYTSFRQGLDAEIEHYRTGHHGAEGSDNWRWFALYLFNEGLFPPLSCAAALGIVYGLVRRARKALLLLTFPLLYYGLLSAQRVRFARNLMPLLPFLAVFVGWLLGDLFSRLEAYLPTRRGWRLAGYAIVTLAALAVAWLLVSTPLRTQAENGYWMQREDTRTISKRWIEENLPPGCKIALEAYTPPLEFSFRPGSQQPLFNYKRFWRLADQPLSYYRRERFDYLVVSSMMYDRYLKDRSYPQQREFYIELFNSWALVKEFRGHPAPMHDPVIRIYKVPR